MKNGGDVEKWLNDLGGATFRLGCLVLLGALLLPFVGGCLVALWQQLK